MLIALLVLTIVTIVAVMNCVSAMNENEILKRQNACLRKHMMYANLYDDPVYIETEEKLKDMYRDTED